MEYESPEPAKSTKLTAHVPVMTNTKLSVSAEIVADRKTIWKMITSEHKNNNWSKALTPLSFIQSDWLKGSPVLYLDDFQSGVIGIVKQRTEECIEVTFQGILNSGYEDFTSETARHIQGKGEKYTVIQNEKSSRLSIEADVDSIYIDRMTEKWTKALREIKKLAEEDLLTKL